jgi:hypothetical protein
MKYGFCMPAGNRGCHWCGAELIDQEGSLSHSSTQRLQNPAGLEENGNG